MLKKSSVLLPSYYNFHCLYCPQLAPVQTSTSSPKSQRSRYFHPWKISIRCFAAAHSETRSTNSSPGPPWPDLSSPNAVPNPYQIFGLEKNSPYSKRRFYELVKIYHPDRSGHGSGPSDTSLLSGPIKMERYRLIVTAHQILSDPVKRRAYDRSGAGWGRRLEYGAPKQSWGHDNETRWAGFDTHDSPFRNATWEDWEKWYQRCEGKQEPVYFFNGGFLMLVLAVVFLGGFGQSVRVRDYSNLFQRQVEKIHDDASNAIRQRRAESQGFGSRDERLQNFLKMRQPHGYGSADTTEESYRKLLQEPERSHDHG